MVKVSVLLVFFGGRYRKVQYIPSVFLYSHQQLPVVYNTFITITSQESRWYGV
jgi:hypothetical protein